MSAPTDDTEYHIPAVSSLRSKFEQLAAQSAGAATPTPTPASSARGRGLVQYGGPATSSSQSLGPSEFGEGIPRVRARSTPSAPAPLSVPGIKGPAGDKEAVGNGAPKGGVQIVAPTPRRTSEVRASPSSPDLGVAYRREAYLDVTAGQGASSEGATPVEGPPPRPLSRRSVRTPAPAESTTATPTPQAHTSAPAPPPPPSAPPAPVPTASPKLVPTVVVDTASALTRKPPPPPPPLRPRTSGDSVPQIQLEIQLDDPKPKYIGIPKRSPSERSISPVTRSLSAPVVTAPRPILNGAATSDGSVDQHQYSESPPPIPARPGSKPVTDELGRRTAPSAPSTSSTLPLRHRPTVSTSAVPIRGPPPSVPPRPAAAKASGSPVSRDPSLSPEIPPPLPSRSRVSPVQSEEPLPVLVPPSLSPSSSLSLSAPATAPPPRLPLRKSVLALPPPSSASLPPETSPGVARLPRSAPPTHPLLEKRQMTLDAQGQVTSHPPPSPMPAHLPPPSRSLDTTLIPSSPIPPHLPPPTRMLSAVARPTPTKRVSGDDDSDTDEEYDPADQLSPPLAAAHPVPYLTPGTGLKKGVEELPDATHSNRRPPYMFPDRRSFPASAHFGQYPVLATAGSVVVLGNWSVRVYDVDKGREEPTLHVDLDQTGLEWRVKEPRVTAMEFRPGAITEEDGRFLWCGMKDGHLWELDLWTGQVTDKRAQAHSSAVTHIFRHGRTMVTIEEAGKMFVFDNDESVNVPEMGRTPRLIRIGEKQAFARVLGRDGQVWTSDGQGLGGPVGGAKSLSSTPTRGPAIRVYDIRPPDKGAVPYRTIVCPEPLGAVTAGCILPTQPDVIYLGHEGGCMSLWTRTEEEPTFIKSVKIGPSDVLALEGVMNRLWIGNRQGIIAAYDVSTWPWKVTNVWKAHGDSPITKMLVDVIGIERNQRLSVVSTGKDERLRIWDGLLSYHWINDELLKREDQFSTFRSINVLLCTWNVDAAKPEALTGTPENATFFESVLHSIEAPDIIVFSFQELIDLENRKLTAKTVLLGSGKRSEGGISEKVSRRYKLWYDRLVSAVRIAMPPDQPYVPILTENLVGLFMCVFVRASEKSQFNDVSITTVKRGMGGMYGNKGAIVARFTVDDSSICFVNCHLAAGQSHVRERNSDVAAVLEDPLLLPETELEDEDKIAYGGGGDGTMVLDHEICFLNGDLNYRIDQRHDAVISNVKNGSHEDLLPYDQLQKEMRSNPGFRLRGFTEPPITFKPTYKYDKRSDDYDSSGKKRTPAWCDRILYRSRDPSRVQVVSYKRYEANISDHRPVAGAFRVTVKSLTHELRQQVKEKLQEEVTAEENKSLSVALAFYQEQGLLVQTKPH